MKRYHRKPDITDRNIPKITHRNVISRPEEFQTMWFFEFSLQMKKENQNGFDEWTGMICIKLSCLAASCQNEVKSLSVRHFCGMTFDKTIHLSLSLTGITTCSRGSEFGPATGAVTTIARRDSYHTASDIGNHQVSLICTPVLVSGIMTEMVKDNDTWIKMFKAHIGWILKTRCNWSKLVSIVSMNEMYIGKGSCAIERGGSWCWIGEVLQYKYGFITFHQSRWNIVQTCLSLNVRALKFFPFSSYPIISVRFFIVSEESVKRKEHNSERMRIWLVIFV